MTVKEVASHMGVSQEFVREAIVQGKLRGGFYIQRKDRKVFYIDREEFLKGGQ